MNKIKCIVILGAGEQSQVIANIFKLNGYLNFVYLDDKQSKYCITKGKLEDYKKYKEELFFIAIGNNNLRKKWFQKLKKNGVSFANALHPTAYLEKGVTLGENVMIGAKSYININTVIKDNVIINNGCLIEHDNLIEENSQLAPGVVTGGKVTIKELSFVGLKAVINDHTTVERNNLIGSGAVVIKNTEANKVYVGIPAKKIKNNE